MTVTNPPISPARRARALQQDLIESAAQLSEVAEGRSAADLLLVFGRLDRLDADDLTVFGRIVDLVAVALAQEVGR